MSSRASRPDLPSVRPEQPPEFAFPKSHSFPPLYTLQPNPTTRAAQFQIWSRCIQLYCRFYRTFLLPFPDCVELPLFRNTDISRHLSEADVRIVLTWIASTEGGMRGEWRGFDGYWVYWRRPEEWAELIWRWVDEVGQKGAVLTFYELLHGEATAGQGKSLHRWCKLAGLRHGRIP